MKLERVSGAIVAVLMREEMDKIRDEMRNATIAENNGGRLVRQQGKGQR